MTAEKQICFGICICQMTAILSGVSLLYLAVIVIIPSKNELAMDFKTTPIMCTTILAEDIARKDTKTDPPHARCEWTTCGEWCLSKGSGTCMQIYVMVRNNGSKVNFRDCVDILDNNCSALNVTNTRSYKCKQGECKDITGLFYCTKDLDFNDCKDISPAFVCQSKSISQKAITCEDKCGDPLDGIFSCESGQCRSLGLKNYQQSCERKCTNLEMRERNVVIFSRERMVATACKSMDSPDNSSSANIESVSNNQEWRDKRQAIFLFCSYVKVKKGNKTYDILTEDCFNATMGNTEDLNGIKDYLNLLALHQSLGNHSEWIIQPEVTLRVMNNTQLRINNDGCVNTLRKECTAFFKTHAHDGADGITQDRFPCYYTDKSSDYVLGKYNPSLTATFLLVFSILPACLFILACSCLFFCSKSVGVDDEGHLRVTLLQGGGAGAAKEPVQFDELL